MSNIKLILLDFDGTLADTRIANGMAYIQALSEVGINISIEEYTAKYFGMRCREFLRDVAIVWCHLLKHQASVTWSTST